MSENPSYPEQMEVSRTITQDRVDHYASAARDPNPIHRETPEARASQFGRPVAHGMLVLAVVSEMMSSAFGTDWGRRGSIKVRWRAPALPPLSITAKAQLREASSDALRYDVSVDDDDGELLLAGQASLRLAGC